MTRKSVLMVTVAVLFMAIGAYVGVMRQDPAPTPAEPAGATATAALFRQTLPDSRGQPQNLAQWQGKVLLVNFWATWCAPCVEEMPELTALQSELQGKNIQVIGIGIDSADNISQFSAKHGITYPLYVAGSPGTDLIRAFGNRAGGLPYTVLIGADGRVKKTYLGRLKMPEVRRDLIAQ